MTTMPTAPAPTTTPTTTTARWWAGTQTDRVYRQHRIRQHPISGDWQVSRDGYHLGVAPTAEAARVIVDDLLDEG